MYEENPFPSASGTQVLKDMFTAIFRPDKSDPSKLAEGVNENRNYFNSHKASMVNLMRRFLGGYIPVDRGDSQDSGIYICDPNFGGCGRVDQMFNFEFVDMGVYNAKNWMGSLDLKRDKIWSQKGYPVIARVRCNDYNHCQDCNATFATRTKGRSCIYCGSSNTKGGGCGHEHMAVHMVRETTVDNIEAQTLTAIKPTNYVLGTVRQKPAQLSNTKPFAFRLTYGGVPYDKEINTFKQACEHIPNLEVGYQVTSDGYTFYRPNKLVSPDGKEETFFGTPSLNPTSTTNIMSSQRTSTGEAWQLDPEIADLEYQDTAGYRSSKRKLRDDLLTWNHEPSRYPISKMRYAFTMEPQQRCFNHPGYRGRDGSELLWGLAGHITCPNCQKTGAPYDRSRGGTVDITCRYCSFDVSNLTPFSSPRPLTLCPECGKKTDPLNIRSVSSGVRGKLIYPRKKLFVKADDKVVPLKKIGEKPMLLKERTLLLVTDDAEDGYSYELHLKTLFTTIPIPRDIQEAQALLGIGDGEGGSKSDSCPKDLLCDLLGNPLSEDSGKGGPTADPEGVCELPNGDLINTTELGCLALSGDYKGDNTNVTDYVTARATAAAYPASGVTFPAFTWLVCEGRAQSAYRNDRRKWVDMSVPNQVYRDPQTGTSGTLRTFPRFSEGPSYDPRTKAGELQRRSKYLWMNPKSHMMMDIFNHCSINLRGKSPDSAFANPTHRPKALGYVDTSASTAAPLYRCRTCLSMMTYGRDLAFKNDPSGAGNPYSKPWTSIGGAANLREAWNNGSPEKYYPGVEVMWERRRMGTYTGWVDDNTPTFLARRLDVYSERILQEEIKETQRENGWWYWIHDPTIKAMATSPGAYII